MKRPLAHLISVSLFALVSIADAGPMENKLLERWYAALSTIDRTEIAALLSDKAVITLNDIEIEQSKPEFLSSLDEWEGAMKGTSIRHTLEPTQDGSISMLVCYHFPNNESLMRETFAIEADKIISSTQSTIADNCADLPN